MTEKLKFAIANFNFSYSYLFVAFVPLVYWYYENLNPFKKDL